MPLLASQPLRRSVRSLGIPHDDDDEDMATFSGMTNSLADVDAIEREVDAQLTLLDPFATPDAIARAQSVLRAHDQSTRFNGQDDDDAVVEAFVSHQPQYKRSIVAKKLQLYEKQLAFRDKQLEALRVMHETALATVDKLKEALETQQKEFDAAQDEWEDEKEKLLRFRAHPAGSAHAGGGAMLFQMKMGVSAAAMAARTRTMNEADAQRQREMRLQMLRGAADVQDQLDDDAGLGALAASAGASSWRLWRQLRRFVAKRLYPFASDVRQIEARFGHSVASYFRFFRWIIMSFLAISIPSLAMLVVHVLYLKDAGRTVEANWTAFTGVFPAYLLFSMYLPVEGTLYTFVLLVIQAMLLLFSILKWIAEDRQSKTLEAVDAGSKQPKFSRIVLNAWDFTSTTREQASDLKKSIVEQVKVAIREEEMVEKLRRRTRKERYKLYVRRAAAFVVYVVIQAVSWYLIIKVTTQSSEIQTIIAQKANFLAPYVSSIIPAVVTVINGVLPTIISLLTNLEKWDDVGFAIKAMVTRLYLAKVLNVGIQLVSYALLLDPYLFTGDQSILEVVTFYGPSVRKNVMLAFKPDIYACRADQVASGLLTLVVTDFIVGKVAAISSPVLAWITAKATAQWTRFREKRSSTSTARVVPIITTDDLSSDTMGPEPIRPQSASATSSVLPELAAKVGSTEEINAQAARSSEKWSEVTSKAAPANETPSPPKALIKSEFQVPQKMVALLYSCTIALVAIPLAPSAAILALILHVINFKVDKLFLVYFQKKPTNPWSAKDAGSFFIKFYFCTVVIFMVFTHFFLSNEHLPKLCNLQDLFLSEAWSGSSEELCLPGSYDAITELCSLNEELSKSAYFLARSSVSEDSKAECLLGYPKCICGSTYACGPFVSDQNGYDQLLSTALSIRGIATVYSVIASSAFIAWVAVLATATGVFFLRNSLGVQAMMAHARENEFAITFAALRKKIKQLENRLRVHKISQDNANVQEDNNSARNTDSR